MNPSMSISERDDTVIDPFGATVPSPDIYASNMPWTNASGAVNAQAGIFL